MSLESKYFLLHLIFGFGILLTEPSRTCTYKSKSIINIGIQGVLKHYKMLLFYGGLCVNFDIIGEISHGSNRTYNQSNYKQKKSNYELVPYLNTRIIINKFSFFTC